MKAHKFRLHFTRINPQLGEYDTTRDYEGTLAGAEKYAEQIIAHTIYGAMILQDIEVVG